MDQQLIPLTQGMDVFGADGGKVGSIQDVQDDYILVEKGFFFPKDYYIPWSAIQGVTEDNDVYLTITKEDALERQWDTLPRGDATRPATATGTGDVTGATYDTTNSATTAADTTRVPIFEEQVTPVKRPVSRGAVRIQKELMTENRNVEVPVTEERVRISRVASDEPVSEDATGAFEEGVVEVPIRGEEVTLEKTAHKTGEIVVDKERDEHVEQVAGTVRRENVRVDDESVPENLRRRSA